MKYFYLVNEESNRSFAHRIQPTTDEINKATQNGYEWITEEQAIERQLEIPTDAGHYGRITTARTWVVPTRINDKAIQIFWRNEWRAVREYKHKNPRPSGAILSEAITTFCLNAGIPINHDVECDWDFKFQMHDECCKECFVCEYADSCDDNGLF